MEGWNSYLGSDFWPNFGETELRTDGKGLEEIKDIKEEIEGVIGVMI